MSRGTTTAVPVTQPIIDVLPAIYQDGHFLRSFTAGLDDVWSSAFATLDCLHAYVDPALSPDDFLTWLGRWVGTVLDEDWPVARRRRFIGRAVELYAGRGTAGALAEELSLYTDGVVHVDDPGSVTTSRTPGGRGRAPDGEADRTLRIVVDTERADDVNWPALQAVVRAAVPAHLPVEIELREIGGVANGVGPDEPDDRRDDGGERT